MSNFGDLFSGNNSTSYRVLGVGIIASGLVVLTIALIMGIEFPQHVVKSTINDLCIQSESHSMFNIWVHDQYRTRTNRLYFWELTNAMDFLHNGSMPKFVERGPYVYRENVEKIDTRFHYTDKHVVEFYEVHNQTFDEEQTKIECGPHCKDTDEVTILNEDYLRRISPFETAQNFGIHYVSRAVSQCLNQLLNVSNANPNPTESTPQTVEKQCEELRTFDNWAQDDRTANKNDLDSNAFNFSITQLSGLYHAFMNPQTLGSLRTMLTNKTAKDICQNLLIQCQEQLSLQPSCNQDICSYHRISSCGLINLLEIYQDLTNGNKHDTANLTSYVMQVMLCENEQTSCFVLPDSIHHRVKVISLIMDYLHDILVPFAFRLALGSNNDIVMQRSQSQLAKGYFSSENGLTEGINSAYVKGFLSHVPKKELARDIGKHIALLNCYDSIYAQTNFMWHEYEGSHMVDEHSFPNLTTNQRMITSWRDNVAPKQSLTPCASSSVAMEMMDVFMPEFQRKMLFRKNGWRYMSGTKVDEFALDESNMQEDYTYIEHQGLQNMQGVNGYPSWISLPHFLYANEELISTYGMKPNESKHISELSIEPITGVIWHKSYKYQKSLGIGPHLINVGLNGNTTVALHENVTSDMPLPLFWVEQRYEYNERGIEDYHNKVTYLMTASCGGLVSLSIIATFLMGLGAVVMTKKVVATNRVAPAATTREENGGAHCIHSNAHSNGVRNHVIK